jgi:squalene synthase HpnC
MSVDHYENFPVASILLPARLRRPVAVIYAFARSADDFADEGNLPEAERLALLEEYRKELRGLEQNRAPRTPLFCNLASVISAYGLPYEPFFLLLDAFSQDVTKHRYADFPELMEYCRRSADPVGRLMLHLYDAVTSEHLGWSNSICSALQLINFWQDVAIDYRNNRIYLPHEDLARFGVTEAQIAAGDTGGGWTALMEFQIERARALLKSGAPLATRLPGRIGLELRTIVQGGLRILEKIRQARGDVYRRRPVLRAWDWPLLLVRGLAMK